LVVGDSKQVYKVTGDLAPLESVVLPMATLLGMPCNTWRALWQSCVLSSDQREQHNCAALAQDPWYCEYDFALPVSTDLPTVVDNLQRWQAAAESSGVELLAVRARAVFPSEFNRLVRRYGCKAELLTRTTLALVESCIANLDGHVFVICDKHGGRNRYAPQLQEFFPEHLVEIWHEGRYRSLYRFGAPERRVEFRFVAKGDRCLVTGLASMTAKYLRELAMRPLNEFWQRHIPDLRPTAGYPGDSRRFWRDINKVRTAMGIQRKILWRSR